jgi:hypothetical protein
VPVDVHPRAGEFRKLLEDNSLKSKQNFLKDTGWKFVGKTSVLYKEE